jgi:tetratricopeptide (TPR) repeat protein
MADGLFTKPSILTDDTEGYINTDQVDQFCNRFDMRTICDLSRKGMIEQSISASKKAIEQDPQNATAYYNLGNAFGKRGNYEEAFAAFFKAVELDPGYAGPHYGLAVCYYATGHYELAVEHADKAEALGFKVPWRFRRSLKKALRKSG